MPHANRQLAFLSILDTLGEPNVRWGTNRVGYVRSIPVVDANGEDLTVYEFQIRRFLTKVRRLKLCTGELVDLLDDDTFKIVRTGEKLTRAAKE